MTKTRIVIMAKAPLPGLAKTRLVPKIGSVRAARLAERMLVHTLNTARDALVGDIELCMTPAPAASAWRSVAVPAATLCSDQGDGDLGDRLARAAERALIEGPALLIGTDCPALTVEHLRHASAQLTQHDAYIVPAADGGYVLFGLRVFDRHVFRDIDWSTSRVCEQTLQRCRDLGWSIHVGPTLRDIDEPDDLHWLPEKLSMGLIDVHMREESGSSCQEGLSR